MTEEQKLQIIRLRNEGCGYTTVADKLGMSKDTVKSFCRRNGLNGKAVQTMPVADIGSVCRECGKPVVQETGKKQRVFCGDECRSAWWRAHPEKINQRAVYSFTCVCCNQPFTAYGNSKRKYCSHECYIKHRFKGGDDDGDG